jgi:hypothetical protein
MALDLTKAARAGEIAEEVAELDAAANQVRDVGDGWRMTVARFRSPQGVEFEARLDGLPSQVRDDVAADLLAFYADHRAALVTELEGLA